MIDLGVARDRAGLVGTGSAQALSGYLSAVTEPASQMAQRRRFALLGDSIAWGQGAARQDERLGPRLQRALQDHGLTVELGMFAVPGARSRGLEAQLDKALAWQPDLALVVIGANDLAHREPVGRRRTRPRRRGPSSS